MLGKQDLVGQWSRVDSQGTAAGSHTSTHSQWCILDNDTLGGLYTATLFQSHEIRIGIGLAAFHVVGCHNMLLVDKLTEVIDKALEERTLSTASDDTYL